MRRAALAMVLLAGACAARPPYDPRDACAMVIEQKDALLHAPPSELVDLAYGTPVEGTARSGYAQSIAIVTIGGVGAAALVTGLVMGFVADPSQANVRTAGYAVAGGAIGLGAISLILGFTARATIERARNDLASWAKHCEARY